MRAFLFDLDDTLFDHRFCTRCALAVIQAHLPSLAAMSIEALADLHGQVLEEYHREVLAGRLDVDAARLARFRKLVELQGGRVDADGLTRAAAAYREAYLAARRPVPGAAAVLQALRALGPVAVVSNNVLAEQVAKIDVCGLGAHIDALVVSEEVGVAKPDPRIFLEALRRIGASPDHAVMIGDSWTADIAGARAAGIAAVWFNPLRLPCPDPSWLSDELHGWEPAEEAAGRVGGWKR